MTQISQFDDSHNSNKMKQIYPQIYSGILSVRRNRVPHRKRP